MAKIEKIFLLQFDFSFLKKLIRNLKKKTFCYGVELLFLFDLSPNTTM